MSKATASTSPRKGRHSPSAGGAAAGGASSSQEGQRAADPLQRGHMFVLFRPKIDVEEAHSLKEVQRVYLWLSPEKVPLADYVSHPLPEPHDGHAHAGDKRKHADTKAESSKEAAAGSGTDTDTAQPASPKYKKARQEKSTAEGEEAKSETAGAAGAPSSLTAHPLASAAKGIHSKHVLLMLPSKRLPSSNVRAPHWAFVDEVGDTVDDIKKKIGTFHYHTQTKGDRTQEGARIVAECVYEIAREGKHTYLYYALEHPHDVTEVQKAFGIAKEGIILIQAKNPHSSNANRDGEVVAGLSKSRKSHYPPKLQAEFKGIRVAETKFAPLHPEMLNYAGSELLLLGVKATPKAVLGAEEVEFLQKVAELEATSTPTGKAENKEVTDLTGVDTEPALEYW